MSVQDSAADAASLDSSAQGINAESGVEAAENASQVAESISAAEFYAYKQQQEKQQGALSAAFRRMEKALRESQGSQQPEAPTDTAPAQGDGRLDARLKELEATQKAISEREAQINAATIRMEMQKALEDGGVPKDVADDYADLLAIRNQQSIGVDYVGGRLTAQYEAYEGADKVPVSSFVSEFLQTDKGKALIAPRNAPTGGGRQNGQPPQSGKTYITKAEMSSLSIEELKTGNYILKD